MPRHETMERDLKRAGIAKKDAAGKTADFHSLRYFFCTEMGKRLTIQKVRVLMRHANIKQTCDTYMDLGLSDVGEVEDSQAGTAWSQVEGANDRAPLMTGLGIGLLSAGGMLALGGSVVLLADAGDQDGDGALDSAALGMRACF